MSIFERGHQEKEKPVVEPVVSRENNSSEDPSLAQDAEAQATVDEQAAAKLLDRIKSGVIEEGEAVPEDEKRKLLKVSHNKWIEGMKDAVKTIGYNVVLMATVDLILKRLGIELPIYLLAAVTIPSMYSLGEKKDKK